MRGIFVLDVTGAVFEVRERVHQRSPTRAAEITFTKEPLVVDAGVRRDPHAVVIWCGYPTAHTGREEIKNARRTIDQADQGGILAIYTSHSGGDVRPFDTSISWSTRDPAPNAHNLLVRILLALTDSTTVEEIERIVKAAATHTHF